MKYINLITAVLILCCAVGQLSAQDVKNADIIGSLVDENTQPLESATLMLLNASDSVLVGFTTSESDGRFIMKRVAAGEYLLKVNFLGYAPLYKDVSIAESDKGGPRTDRNDPVS